MIHQLALQLMNILHIVKISVVNETCDTAAIAGTTILVPLCSQVSPTHINTLRPRQNGRHFPDNIFNCIFLNENV